MNKVEIQMEGAEAVPYEKKCRQFVEKVLEYRNINGWEVSILFCGNDMIRSLNKKYREKDEPTDVLTFCQFEGELPESNEVTAVGDIVISIEYLQAHAGEYGVTADNELKRVLIHGILHLEGMDHHTSNPSEEMLVLQEDILKNTEGESIL